MQEIQQLEKTPVLATGIAYVGAYTLIFFVALCLACGLYYLSELCSEYTRQVKKIVGNYIKVNMLLYFLLWSIDRLPLYAIVMGLIAQVQYYRLWVRFPLLSWYSLEFFLGLILSVCNHIVWMRWFFKANFSLEYTICFFTMMIWMVPAALIIAVAANDYSLPTLQRSQKQNTPQNQSRST